MKKKIIAISGSTRPGSTNLNLIKAIAGLAVNRFDVTVFNDIATIPHFNPDLDNNNPPEAVTAFRKLLAAADGILICTPEYAMGVPGTLKNAIDWTVSSCEFSHKPTALITASSVGQKGHASLMETLKVIEARVTDKTHMVISHAKTKVSSDCKITDAPTLEKVSSLIASFIELMETAKTAYL
ncbi:MAG: NADPH-dependent FMN reductase [Bacteroidetes bacterium]|nr:MAG: NADPH-dependent FMN reductase [Bacteroidota bacterium]